MATAVKSTALPDDEESQLKEAGMDKGTIFGILAGVSLIVVAIIRGGSADVFVNLNGVFIVCGGTLATAFIAFPSKKITGMIPIIINAFKPDVHQPSDYIDEIMALVTKYRSGGMKGLESAEEFLDNRFLKEGIAMVVDGFNAREITEIMERQISSVVERHNQGQKILRFMAVQAPIFGMAGTLIGLIQMLMHIDDPSSIGPSLAVALITTFYGIIFANLILTPIVAKLNARTENEAMLIKAIRLGVIGIHDRLNPQKNSKEYELPTSTGSAKIMSNVDEILGLTAQAPCQDGVDFTGYDLKGISMNGVTFIFATLKEVNFDECELVDVNFSKADLGKATFRGAKLKDVIFSNVQLQESDFENATLVNCNFENASIEQSNFASFISTGCSFKGANLSFCNFYSANIEESNLSFSRIMYSNLKQVAIDKSNLTGCNARGSDFSFSNISEAKMKGSNLKHVDLNSCSMKDVDLTLSNMLGVEFKDAVCPRIKLEEVNFEGADLTYASLEGANLQNAFFLEANLHGTNLTSANLKDAFFVDANTHNIKTKGANLENTGLTET